MRKQDNLLQPHKTREKKTPISYGRNVLVWVYMKNSLGAGVIEYIAHWNLV